MLGFCLFSHGITRWQGAIFFAGIVAYTGFNIYDGKKNGCDDDNDVANSKIFPYWVAILFVTGGLAALIGGAKLFVNSAIFIAKAGGISDAVIGLTVVALGTSLPELATSVVAAIKGENDIAIANVVGSNIFNILAILGVAPLIAPIKSAGISMIDMYTMLGISILLIAFMKQRKINRWMGAIFLVIYTAYTVWLFFKG